MAAKKNTGEPFQEAGGRNDGRESRWSSMIPDRVNSFAIIKAAAVALVVSLVFGWIIGVVFFVLLPESISTGSAFVFPIHFQWLFYIFELLVNVLGGYLAATYAGRNFLFHAYYTGVLLHIAYSASCLIPSGDVFTFFDSFTLLLTIPLAVTGGAIHLQMTRKKENL